VEYLTDKEGLDHDFNDVADSIGVDPANLRNYLYNNKSAKREKLLEMLIVLNKKFRHNLEGWKTDNVVPFSHEHKSSPEAQVMTEYTTTRIELEALTDMLFAYLSKTQGTPIPELHRQFKEKIEEITKRSAR
jgi:hypothetical protein